MKDQIKKILANADLEPTLKVALEDSLTALAEHQQKVTRELEEAFLRQNETDKEISAFDGRIITALVDRDQVKDLSAYGFFEVPASTELEDQPIPKDHQHISLTDIYFLNTSYEEMEDLCNQKFKGKSANCIFEYELCPFYGYVNAEKSLDTLWKLYGFTGMRPWSPWARRAVQVHILAPYTDNMNLELKTNGLDGKLLTNKELVWNVDIREDEKVSALDTISPRGDEKVYKYTYTAYDGPLRLWSIPLDVLQGKLAPEEVDVTLAKDITLSTRKAFDSTSCIKYGLHEEARSPGQTAFNNKVDKSVNILPRSKGEFNRLLASFAKDGYSCRLAEEPGKKITRYATFHKTGDRNRLILTQERKNPVDIQFYSKDKEDLFLTDYANWVLEELERRLPMYLWAGVR